MIGVIADPSEHEVIREFFELFKTPWEFWRQEQNYDVLLCSGRGPGNVTARLVVVYAGKKTDFDEKQQILVSRYRKDPCIVSCEGDRLPLYGESVSFQERGNGFLADTATGESLAILEATEGRILVRVGYDLFGEVWKLLTVGQPAANAALPSLEIHIALLRSLILRSGLELAEIPPVPDGYRFIACLTHDVDHPSMRAHKWDHTMFGFMYRATLGSLRRFVRGQMPLRDVFANWAAVFRLPLVHVGLAKDSWREFGTRYMGIENDFRSTFFVIPYKNRPGKTADGAAPAFRASKYDAQDIADAIQSLRSSGSEVGLHGIDAWIDSSKGTEELQEIRRLTGSSEIGVRMHWLLYDENSPVILEKAGASYDSTVGYNETVGYRAGTTQAYRPFGTTQLLELPMHVMDTALFYPSHLALSPKEAKPILDRMVDNAARFGGVLTIDWHDRSVAPERLWDATYRDVIRAMTKGNAWFATANQVVSWFRRRRMAGFEADCSEPNAIRARAGIPHEDHLPGLRLRIHRAGCCFDKAVAESVSGRAVLGAKESATAGSPNLLARTMLARTEPDR